MLIRIDDFLIDHVFQPFAHWIQLLVGRDNFWLAKVSIVLSTLLLEAGNIFVFLANERLYIFLFFSFVILTLTIFVVLMTVQVGKEQNQQQGCMNDFRVSARIFRIGAVFYIMGILVFQVFMGNWFFFLSFVFLFFWWYFLSCTPLPPRVSKMHELWNKLIIKVNEALQSPPEPAKT